MPASSPSKAVGWRPLRIARVDAVPVSLPLARPVLMGAGQRFLRSESLLVRIEAEDGQAGWGEAASAVSFTGEDLPGMVATVRQVLAPLLRGADAMDRAGLELRLGRAIAGCTGAKSACHMAVLDLIGHALGLPLHVLLGGRVRSHPRAMMMLANGRAEDDLREARERMAAGCTLFKLKAGTKPLAEEIGLLRQLRAECPEGIELCADANTGMEVDAAHAYAAAGREQRLLFLEQPFAADALEPTRRLAREGGVPICMDESAHDVPHILRWRAAGAVRGVNLKCIKFGGPAGVLRAAVVCDALGLSINLAAKTGESSIGNAALVQLAHLVPNLDWGFTLVSGALQQDLVREPLRVDGGTVALPEGAGLGVRVDTEAIRGAALEPGTPRFDA